MRMSSLNPRILAIIFTGLLACTVLYLGFALVNQGGKVPVLVKAFPGDAHIMIGDIPVRNGSRIYLEPGTYTITATRDGFKDISDTITLTDIERSYIVMMTPISAEAKKMTNTIDKDTENELTALSERDIERVNEQFYKLNPIAQKLPYKTFTYGIGHHEDPSDPSGNSIIIDIDAHEGYRQAALFQMRQMGYDPTDFNINFRGYSNPFPL